MKLNTAIGHGGDISCFYIPSGWVYLRWLMNTEIIKCDLLHENC